MSSQDFMKMPLPGIHFRNRHENLERVFITKCIQIDSYTESGLYGVWMIKEPQSIVE